MPDFTNINNDITGFIDDINAAQAYHLSNTGHYVQMLYSHSAPPEDEASVAPDNLASQAGQMSFTFEQVMTEALKTVPATMKCRVSVDTYGGPTGIGYVINLSCIIDSKLYHKAINYGSETYRGLSWYEVV